MKESSKWLVYGAKWLKRWMLFSVEAKNSIYQFF
jgi:hypothetical protein